MSFPIRTLSSYLFAAIFSVSVFAQNPAKPPIQPESTNPSITSVQPSVVVVLDASGASSRNFGEMRDAALRFIKSMGDERDVAVVAATDRPTLVADFNADSDALVKRLDQLKPHGRPAIDQAVSLATQKASAESDDAAVVVFVRNADPSTSVTATPPNRVFSSVPVYVIASPESKWKVQSAMQQLAVKSGGVAFFPSNNRELGDMVKETATRVIGHPVIDEHSSTEKNLLRGYERLIVRDLPMEDSSATNEAGGGENLLMQQVLVARLRKAHIFPVVVNGADEHAVDSASSAPIGNALELRATVVEFRRGNKLERQFMVGMKGGAKMKIRVILVDASTNKPVLAFTKTGTNASGMWGGSPEHVQAQAMLNVANQIVDELKRAR